MSFGNFSQGLLSGSDSSLRVRVGRGCSRVPHTSLCPESAAVGAVPSVPTGASQESEECGLWSQTPLGWDPRPAFVSWWPWAGGMYSVFHLESGLTLPW